jgi:type I restriction enzyme S subunit
MSLATYPQYKTSGVEWLGDAPAHWDVRRLRDVANVINGYPFDSKLFAPDGKYPLVRIRDLGTAETAIRYNGEFVEAVAITSADILIGMDGDFNVGRWLGDEVALLNQRMCCVRTRSTPLSIFLRHALPIPLKALNDITYATTVKHLSSLDVEKFKIALPRDARELGAIASFLDLETNKIDRLITEQERLVALSAEKLQATISRAVRQGTETKTSQRDSGIGWLGQVPSHWQIGKVQSFARRETGHTPSRQRPEYWEECTIPWFSLADVWQIREGEVKYVYETREQVSELGIANSAARVLPAGTVILSRTASVGYSAIMGCAMATTQDFINWVCGPLLKPEFLLYVLRGMRAEFDRLMMGSTHQTIYMPDVAKLTMALPPLAEQEAIVEFIEQEAAKLGALKAEAKRAITLLRERRAALVAAVVSGRIDVRGVEAVF